MIDLALIHAPSVYDFRNRDDVLFAYLSNSDSVHVSPIFEMPPAGIFAIEQHARRAGFSARFFNVASRMLRDPSFDVADFLEHLPARIAGFDLHWLVHAHGALELAALYKSIHPAAKTLFGGIASTYYHESLIEYPQVDYVIRGYDTLLPVERLLASRDEAAALAEVPNLSWKQTREIRHNPLSHVPRLFGAAVDWSEVFTRDRRNMTPYNLVIPQAGCEYNAPEQHGYRIIHHGLEAHRRALLSLNWKHRLNFETEWMTRDELVDTSYAAVRQLTMAKHAVGQVPDAVAESIVTRIDHTHRPCFARSTTLRRCRTARPRLPASPRSSEGSPNTTASSSAR